METEFKLRGSKVNATLELISAAQVKKLLKRMSGLLGLFYGISTRKEENIPIVREFSNVFPEDLSGLPPDREIEFCIELTPEATHVFKAPYIEWHHQS